MRATTQKREHEIWIWDLSKEKIVINSSTGDPAHLWPHHNQDATTTTTQNLRLTTTIIQITTRMLHFSSKPRPEAVVLLFHKSNTNLYNPSYSSTIATITQSYRRFERERERELKVSKFCLLNYFLWSVTKTLCVLLKFLSQFYKFLQVVCFYLLFYFIFGEEKHKLETKIHSYHVFNRGGLEFNLYQLLY